MLEEKLLSGQKMIVIRFSKSPNKNCIEDHEKVIKEMGFCWFGKIGITPSDRILDTVFENDTPIIMLYTKGEAYLAELLGICNEQPSSNYPEYYDTELFNMGLYPQAYFKLGCIEKVDISLLEKLRVLSSGRALSDVFSHQCMSSFLHIVYGEYDFSDVEQKRAKKAEEKGKLAKNDCVYRKDGRCTLRTCINYEYECIRPSVCSKQKR